MSLETESREFNDEYYANRDRILGELAALHRLHKAAPLLLTALCDCVAIMERELHGLAVIQPELRAARAAIAMTEPPTKTNNHSI